MIPLSEVTEVRKKKHLGFANSIEVTVGGKREFFTSFLAREEAHRWAGGTAQCTAVGSVAAAGGEWSVSCWVWLPACRGSRTVLACLFGVWPCFPASVWLNQPASMRACAMQVAHGPVAAVQ